MPILRYEMGDRIVVKPKSCACGSPLPAIRVEGRTDDVLRFRTAGGEVVPILPLALWSVLKETPGVLRFQAIQTGPETLTIRLEPIDAGDREAVWARLQSRTRDYFRSQGLPGVNIVLSADLPRRDPKSGKFRQVWEDLGLT
jgi:phenylacetate-coenzyme A ligase PaaK-like adenylate-forming protein